MTDVPTSDEIKDQVAIDMQGGVATFSDGTNSVTSVDPEKRLKVASALARRRSPVTAGSLLGGATQLIGPGGTGE